MLMKIMLTRFRPAYMKKDPAIFNGEDIMTLTVAAIIMLVPNKPASANPYATSPQISAR